MASKKEKNRFKSGDEWAKHIEDAIPAISNFEQHFVNQHFIRARHAIKFHKRIDQ